VVAELSGRAWLAALPDALAAQRQVLTGLVNRCEEWPQVSLFLVGCSLGRGAGDALSDIDAALGVGNEASAERVEAMVVAALPEIGTLVDVLRHGIGTADRPRRRIFAQFADGTQLDLAVVTAADIQDRLRDGGAPDFVSLYQADSSGRPEGPAAYAVTGDQVREWAFLGWCSLIDADKYLRRGSLWEAHNRLNQARHHIWQLWAAAHGALYPWHGLSQVLDHDPGNLPPGIESTVAGLDAADLRRAARASAGVLTVVSAAAARRHPADLPAAMAGYVTRAVADECLLAFTAVPCCLGTVPVLSPCGVPGSWFTGTCRAGRGLTVPPQAFRLSAPLAASVRSGPSPPPACGPVSGWTHASRSRRAWAA